MLAVLEGLGNGGPSPSPSPAPKTPPDFQDWYETKDNTAGAILTESDNAKKAILNGAYNVALAAIPIPVAGWIVAGVTAFMSILGLNIRGRTEHPTVENVFPATEAYTAKIYTMYAALPPDAKAKMIDLVFRFDVTMFQIHPDAYFHPEFQGGPGTLDQFKALITQHGPEYVIRGVVGAWFAFIMRGVDAEVLDQQFHDAFVNWFVEIVLKPMDEYMVEKYNKSVAEYIAMGGKGLSQISDGGGGLLTAGLLFLVPALLKGARR